MVKERSTLRRAGSLVGAALFLLVCLNFVAAFVVAIHLGGDALNGKEEGGRYYLGSHGRYTQVSQQVFDYSKAHWRSVEITWPLAILAGLLFTRGPGRKSRGGFLHGSRREQPQCTFDIETIRAWSERCARYRRNTRWLWPIALAATIGPIAAVLAFGAQAFLPAFAAFAIGLLIVALVLAQQTSLLLCPHCGERPKLLMTGEYPSLLSVDYCRNCRYWLQPPPDSDAA